MPAQGAARGELPPAPAAGERPTDHEAGERLAAAEPGRERRHRPRRVLSEQRNDGVDVAALHRVHVALDDLAEALVAERTQGGLLALVGKSLVDRLAGGRGRAGYPGDRRFQRL